jgi:nucleoside-triphosphatase THEP1
MKSMPKVLLTAGPDLDMTDFVQKIVDTIRDMEVAEIKMAGFLTVQQPGKKGKSDLAIARVDGSAVVVGVQGKGRGKRIGKFLIDEEGLDEALVAAIGFRSGVDLYVIHEIGPLETLSKNFSVAAKMLLKNDKVAVLATVARQGRGFVREVKRLPGIELIEVNTQNKVAIEERVIKDFLVAFAARAQELEESEA